MSASVCVSTAIPANPISVIGVSMRVCVSVFLLCMRHWLTACVCSGLCFKSVTEGQLYDTVFIYRLFVVLNS